MGRIIFWKKLLFWLNSCLLISGEICYYILEVFDIKYFKGEYNVFFYNVSFFDI